jgi:hypothetical protein
LGFRDVLLFGWLEGIDDFQDFAGVSHEKVVISRDGVDGFLIQNQIWKAY